MDVATVGKRLDEREIADGPANGLDDCIDRPSAARERHVRPVGPLLGAKAAFRERVREPRFELAERVGRCLTARARGSSTRATRRARRASARTHRPEIGGTCRATSSPAPVSSPKNATVRCSRSFAIGRPPLARTASRVAREIAARVAASGHSAKNTRCRSGSARQVRRSSSQTSSTSRSSASATVWRRTDSRLPAKIRRAAVTPLRARPTRNARCRRACPACRRRDPRYR